VKDLQQQPRSLVQQLPSWFGPCLLGCLAGKHGMCTKEHTERVLGISTKTWGEGLELRIHHV
jgi:hypothetical protein